MPVTSADTEAMQTCAKAVQMSCVDSRHTEKLIWQMAQGEGFNQGAL